MVSTFTWTFAELDLVLNRLSTKGKFADTSSCDVYEAVRGGRADRSGGGFGSGSVAVRRYLWDMSRYTSSIQQARKYSASIPWLMPCDGVVKDSRPL